MLPSTLPYLEYVASFFAANFIGFGVICMVNPAWNLAFFELPYPRVAAKGPTKNVTAEAKMLADVIMLVHGIRDVFMGVAILAGAFCGSRLGLGWIVLSAGVVAEVDGAACRFIVCKGEWNHWGYGTVVVLLGLMLLRVFDWVPLDRLL